MQLTIDSSDIGNVTVVSPKGHINAHTVKEFDSELQRLVTDKRYRVVISGRDLLYIASAGLGALMGVVEDLRANDGDIRLAELSEAVYNVFDILGFTHLYRVFDSVDAAVDSF